MSVTDIDSQRPHVLIYTDDGKAHVIPLTFFDKVMAGSVSINELDDYQEIMPVIIKEWLGDRLNY